MDYNKEIINVIDSHSTFLKDTTNPLVHDNDKLKIDVDDTEYVMIICDSIIE